MCVRHVRNSLLSGGSTVDAGVCVTAVDSSDFIISALRRREGLTASQTSFASGRENMLCLSGGIDDRE